MPAGDPLLTREGRFVGVVLFESSGTKGSASITEQTVLVEATDQAAARAKIAAWAQSQCVAMPLATGGEWRTRVLVIADVSPMLFDVREAEVTTLHMRPVFDFDVRKADWKIQDALEGTVDEPSNKARRLAEGLSEIINCTAWLRTLAVGSRLGHQRPHFVSVLDSVPSTFRLNAKDEGDWIAAAAELRAALAAVDGDVISARMHTLADRVLQIMKTGGA
jgi:hypothetical protein